MRVQSIDPTLFRETLGHYPTGVAIVTAIAEDGSPAGMVVGTFSSVSLEPPLVAFFPTVDSRSFALIRTAKAFCINVLASDQEALCRQFATSGAAKFDGVSWRPGSLGSPILDGVVSYLECTFEDIREAGDHFIVLGRVSELAVERSTLPLLFFQGGYGRFSSGSFLAAPDPELIAAAQFAEALRPEIEQLSAELEVNCSVLAKIHWDAVQVLASNRSSTAESLPLGHRQPLIPPFGAVFMVSADPTEVDEWLMRGPDRSEERAARNRALLEGVRAHGYSLLTATPEAVRRHDELLTDFERGERLPKTERAVRQATSELGNFFGPDLVPGATYDLANIVVLIDKSDGLPPMALRITGLPASASLEQIEYWVERLQRVAVVAQERIRRETADA